MIVDDLMPLLADLPGAAALSAMRVLVEVALPLDCPLPRHDATAKCKLVFSAFHVHSGVLICGLTAFFICGLTGLCLIIWNALELLGVHRRQLLAAHVPRADEVHLAVELALIKGDLRFVQVFGIFLGLLLLLLCPRCLGSMRVR